MLLRTIPVSFCLLYLAQMVAAAELPSSVRHISLTGSLRRGLSDIPAACQTDCDPFAPFLDGQTCPVTQCCSIAFGRGYFDCFMCVGNATHSTDYTLAQEFVDVVITSCDSEGITLPVLTLPGQDPNRTLATTLPAGASSIPVFAGSAAVRTTISGAMRSASSTTAMTESSTSLQGSATASSPPQSTVTSPPSAASNSAASPGPSTPSSAMAVRPRVGLHIVLGLAALIVFA
ncbi:hypothetical protein GGX14DRAFT_555160 [Mycena pura]|uniref:Extracellular membrane protein CFEM domain-containing protein n=1 Tax=Mycena pura TaxID=153505 RepID=A0AAD6YU37_9AGAR|nr:hypothetical protein GGX14DRAFT_555160 [Mycena pura]